MFLIGVDKFLLRLGHFPNWTWCSPKSTHFRLMPMICACVDGFLCWWVRFSFVRGFINKLFRKRSLSFHALNEFKINSIVKSHSWHLLGWWIGPMNHTRLKDVDWRWTQESGMLSGIVFAICLREWVVVRCHGAFSFLIENFLIVFILLSVSHLVSTAKSLSFEMVWLQ